MTRVRMLAIAGAAVVGLPALALAQSSQPPVNSPGAMNPSYGAPASAPNAGGSAANTSGVVMDASQMPPAQAAALAAGDNQMVTNGPVPDTAANRAKYGGPMSHGGRKTPPAGN